jgi:hypothetical protein
MQLPWSEEQRIIAEEVAKDVPRAKFYGWFFGITGAVILLIMLFNWWRDAVVGPVVGVGEFIMRMAVAIGAFGVGLFILRNRLIRPGLKRAKKRIAELKGAKKSRVSE